MSEDPKINYQDTIDNAELAHHVAYAEEPWRAGKERAQEIDDAETADHMEKLMGEAALKARSLFYEDETKNTAASIREQVRAELVTAVEPLYEITLHDAEVSEALIVNSLEQAKRDVTMLKNLSGMLPKAVEGGRHEHGGDKTVRRMYADHTHFEGVTTLHEANYLFARTVWMTFFDRPSNVTGIDHSQYTFDPGFIIGQRQDGKQKEVLFLAPAIARDLDKDISVSGKEEIDRLLENKMIAGNTKEPELYSVRMSEKQFSALLEQMDARHNKGLSESVFQQISQRGVYPENIDKLVLQFKNNKDGLNKFKYVNGNTGKLYFDNILKSGDVVLPVAQDRPKPVTPEYLATIGGLDQFDADYYIAEHAVNFGFKDKLDDINRTRHSTGAA